MEDDCDKVLRIAKIESLVKRRDRMCIELIKQMSNPDHKLHSLLPKKICEVRKRTSRLNNQMYYNFMGKPIVLRVSQSAMLLASTMKHCLGSFSFIPL